MIVNGSTLNMRLLIIFTAVICIRSQNIEGTTENRNVTLTNGEAVVVQLTSDSLLTILSTGNLTEVTFVVCQVHTQKSEVTLSLKKEFEYATSKTGQDIGIVTAINEVKDLKWYLYSNSTENINVLLHLTFLYANDPVPGGCNEEFNLENDSNLELKLHATKMDVLFQWSNTGYIKGVIPQCEDREYQSYLDYDVYVRYIEGGDFTEETFFNVMKSMLSAAHISKHGRKIKTMKNEDGTKSVANLSSYKQQGVVYAVVVRNTQSGTHSAYIPAATYACNLQDMNACKHKDVVGIILSTIGGIFGLFLCFLGHRYFKTANFLFGFLIFALITYQVIMLETDISLIGSLSLAGILGLLGGALLLSLWWNCGIPIINVLFIGLVAGYLVSSILFYTPFGNITYWDSPFNYGAAFACGVLVVPVILLYFTRFLNIFTCAMVGSYLVVVALDTYLGSGIRYIVLNAVRHGTDRDYVKVTVTGPYTLSEIALTVVWAAVFLAGVVFQVIRERKRAPFPPCPRQMRSQRDLRSLLWRSTRNTSNEREPLIRGENRLQYGTTPEVVGSSTGEGSEEEVINKPRMV